MNKEDYISTFQPIVRTTLEPSGHLTPNSQHDDTDTLSRMSDTASKIASLETNLSDLNNFFGVLLVNCHYEQKNKLNRMKPSLRSLVF
jgi:hypothetical protein